MSLGQAKGVLSSAAGSLLARFVGPGTPPSLKPYTLTMRVHLNAMSKRSILDVMGKIERKLRDMEAQGGETADMARQFIASFFELTEHIEVVGVAERGGKIESGHV